MPIQLLSDSLMPTPDLAVIEWEEHLHSYRLSNGALSVAAGQGKSSRGEDLRDRELKCLDLAES